MQNGFIESFMYGQRGGCKRVLAAFWRPVGCVHVYGLSFATDKRAAGPDISISRHVQLAESRVPSNRRSRKPLSNRARRRIRFSRRPATGDLPLSVNRMNVKYVLRDFQPSCRYFHYDLLLLPLPMSPA